jgi:hypothetical protein
MSKKIVKKRKKEKKKKVNKVIALHFINDAFEAECEGLFFATRGFNEKVILKLQRKGILNNWLKCLKKISRKINKRQVFAYCQDVYYRLDEQRKENLKAAKREKGL